MATVAPTGYFTRWPNGQDPTSLTPGGGRILATWNPGRDRMVIKRPGGARHVAAKRPLSRRDLVGSRPPYKSGRGRWPQNDQGKA